ncbi:TonB family protein [Glacieibacterium frigidum]|nr:TonB family protein [Glacieibacterium frigidum]
MTSDPPFRRDRAVAGLIAIAVHALLIALLLIGLRARDVAPEPPAMTVFEVPPPRIEPVTPPRLKTGRRAGRAAPPAARAQPTPVVAPPPVIVPETPPPIAAAPVAGTSFDASAGAAPLPGPGTGAGGVGDGLGSGDDGDGDGDGGGTPSRWLRGEIRDSDYPREAYEAGVSGSVGIRFVVGVNGRVTSCEVIRTSGNAALDATTCRLIIERRRYRPARDRDGRKIPEAYRGDHVWRYMGDRERPGD